LDNEKVTFRVYSLVFSMNRMYTRRLLSTVTHTPQTGIDFEKISNESSVDLRGKQMHESS